MSTLTQKKSLLDKVTVISRKFASNDYVKAIQGGFSAFMPLMILSSLATLLSALVFNDGGFLSGMINAETLSAIRSIFTMITNGSNNIISIVLVAGIAYYLAKTKNFENQIGAVMTAISIMVIFMPLTFPVTVGDVSGEVNNMLPFNYTGTNGILVSMLVGMLGTKLFITFSNNKKLQITMPAGVPEATAKSFNVMIPTILTGFIFAIVSFVFRMFGSNVYQFVMEMIQLPLKGLATSALGFIVVSLIANFTFTLGIHSSVINSVVLRPFLSANFNENVLAVAAGEVAPNIISDAFMAYYQRIGGAGCVLALVIAIFIVGRKKQNREMAKIGMVPALFNIGEPMIFGMPIMLNPIMMVPFVLCPVVCIVIGYALTAVGFVDPLAIYTPSTTPVIISGFLASAGDLKVCLIQLLLLIICTLIYIPFVKLYEKILVEEED